MTQSHSSNQSNNSYIIDPESGAEMARLIDQDSILTQAQGGLFSEREDFSTIVDVLDIASGPGGWVLDVALTYPEIEVTGIDISKSMIEYARAYAKVRELHNAHFQVMNALNPLEFPTASFDLVNARTIIGFVFPAIWPQLIAECRRILRPGGILRLTEFEWGFTNKPAFETYCSLVNRAFFLAGRSFSPTGKHMGITPMLEPLMRTGGFHSIKRKAHALDCSAGAPAFPSMYEDCKSGFQLMQPFLISTQVASHEEIEHLYEQVMDEMLSDDFCSLSYFLTTWGETSKA